MVLHPLFGVNVVYQSFPTSNHNLPSSFSSEMALFTSLFLHQTTTSGRGSPSRACCLPVFSYIKPQLLKVLSFLFLVVYQSFPTSNHNVRVVAVFCRNVVYQSFPTSNHNLTAIWLRAFQVVYQSFPTSNHNRAAKRQEVAEVVYQSFPTSNHNPLYRNSASAVLFTSLFLHQTTTNHLIWIVQNRLFTSLFLHQTTTALGGAVSAGELFTSLFLHQTTTRRRRAQKLQGCLPVFSYIKPQLFISIYNFFFCCLPVFSYIKPQPIEEY